MALKPSSPRAKAVFLDKDGTVIDNLPFKADPGRMTLARGAAAGLQRFNRLGYLLLVVSNQPGVAFGRFGPAALAVVERRLRQLLWGEGLPLAGFYYCPHHPHGSVPEYARLCTCRKPWPGMLLRAATEHGIDLRASWMAGDILDDVEAGRRAGCRTVLIDNGGETVWRRSRLRWPDVTAPDLDAAARLVEAAGAPP
jgi:D,D-heptose 1,7-bisphosphate phosphatase